MTDTPKKKVVRRQAKATTPSSSEPAWTPSPEAKKQATTLRIVSFALWIVAIAAEAFTIFWVLKQQPVNMWLLIGLIVLIAVLALVGGLLWKKANRLDPASRKDPVRFFVQNQLGPIMAAIAFLPLIVMIFLNKNMDGKQKGIAGGIAIVLLVAVGLITTDWNAPSQEQYAAESNIVTELTGEDVVYWTKSGSVFHVCDAVPAVNKASKDGQIYEGSVGAAHADGKSRLTKQWESEATKHCGYTQEQVDAVKAALPDEVALLEQAGSGNETE